MNVLRFGLLIMVGLGCVNSADLAWTIGDIGVGSMAWLNIVAIVLLSNIAMKAFRDYESQMKAGTPREDITFDPTQLDIKGATFWEEKVKAANK